MKSCFRLLLLVTAVALSQGQSTLRHDMDSTSDSTASSVRGLSSPSTVVSYTAHQTRAIQIVATTMASISMTAAIIALYWFCLMRRNYRRDLVMLLLLSDLLKNFCFVLFAGVNFNSGPVQSGDTFCQASGYMLQTGLEACDFAIFFIGLHMFLQIFPMPNSIFGYDGLYNVRYWVYGLWFALPNITASLAFINNNNAYAVQGTWCWLPVRPFWYRLALAWIPRYVISILIMGMATAIFVHVGFEFSLFGKNRGRSLSSDTMSIGSGTHASGAGRPSITSVSSTATGSRSFRMHSGLPLNDANVDVYARNMFVSAAVGKALPEKRRMSLPTWTSPFDASTTLEAGKRGSQSETATRRGSKQVTFGPSVDERMEPLSPLQQPEAGPVRPSMASIESSAAGSTKMSLDGLSTSLPTLAEVPTLESSNQLADAALKARNHAIRRQIRGLFAYPVAYIAFWIMPFVMHCMNYTDRFAAHPLFPIAITSSFCVTSLGAVDVIIFCWRERPWCHIPNSDGTFLGSFNYWKLGSARSRSRTSSVATGIVAAEQEEAEAKQWSSKALSIFRSMSPWRRLSSGSGTGASDRRVREQESAQARLRLERAEMEEKVAASAAVGDHAGRQQTSEQREQVKGKQKSPGARNWFDQDVQGDPLELMRTRERASIVGESVSPRGS